MNIKDELISAFNLFSDRISIREDEKSLTYKNLYDQSLFVASYLSKQNIKNGCIAIEIADATDHIIAIVGVILSGNYYISITPENKPFFSRENELPVAFTIWSNPSDISNCFISIDEILSSSFVDDTIFTSGISPNDKLCAFFTSGSTGSSKIIVHNHGTIYTRTMQEIEKNEITCDDKLDFIFSLSFSASLSCIFPALMAGAELCIFNLKNIGLHLLVDFWESNKITFTTLSVSVFQGVCKITQGKFCLPTLRFVSISAEPVRDTTLAFFREKFSSSCILQIAYASTETRTISDIKIYNNGLTHPFEESIGRPVSEKHVFIADEKGEKLNVGVIGEIVVESEFIADSYYGMPAESSLVFRKINNLIQYKTGDLGYMNEDGYLFYCGRKENDSKVNGIKLNIKNIEDALEKVNGIFQAVAVVNNSHEQAKLICFFQTNDADLSIADIRKSIASKLPVTHMPHFYFQLDQFPLTHSGKIDRKKLKELSIDEFIAQSKSTAASVNQNNGDYEEVITDVFKKVLEIDEINADSDFYEQGGDSFTTLLLIAEIEHRLGITLQSFVFIPNSTPKKLSAYVSSLQQETITLVSSVELNGYSAEKNNLYFLNNSVNKKYDPFVESILSDKFNLVALYYDLRNSYKINNADQIILKQLSQLIICEKNPVVVGYSFDGFMAQQLACIVPQISFCILIDTYNYFDYDKYELKSRFKDKFKLLRQTTATYNDYLLPFLEVGAYLKRRLKLEKSSDKNGDYGEQVKGINYILKNIKQQKAINNCIYFQASRSYYWIENHGSSWESHINGDFHFYTFAADHFSILKTHASVMAQTIIKIIDEASMKYRYEQQPIAPRSPDV